MDTKLTAPAAARWASNHLRASVPLFVLMGYLLLYGSSELAPGSVLQLLVAGCLAVFASGCSLVAVLFPRRSGLDPLERIALAGCLSLALGGVAAYILARLPWGLHVTPLLLVAGVFNFVCYLLAQIQRNTAAEQVDIPLVAPLHCLAAWSQRQTTRSLLVTLVLVCLLVAAVGRLHSAMLAPAPDPAMTEFFLLSEQGEAQGYPHTASPGEAVEISYGIVNRAEAAATYQVRAELENRLLAIGEPIELAPGQAYQAKMNLFIPDDSSALARISFTLLQANKPSRELWLWLDVAPPPAVLAAL